MELRGAGAAAARKPKWEAVELVKEGYLLPDATIRAQLPKETGLYMWCVKPPARCAGSGGWNAMYLGQAGGGSINTRSSLHSRLKDYVSDKVNPNIVGPAGEGKKRAYMQDLQERGFSFQIR